MTVSELTAKIKVLLEDKFPFIWICGEISNFSAPASGHFYFTLKDARAQIKAVMFKGQNRNLKFRPENGMAVTGLGRVAVYEPQGAYQVIFEYLEPSGAGALQAAYEQLKSRLAQEGLFEPDHKTPLPFIPAKISLITSPTGAVVHDILNVLDRRFSNIPVQIFPVKVQGDDAARQITRALDCLNHQADSDLIILARGGGSLEDLQAFNSEAVARAVFASKIPVVSAVGHETDYTIVDFVSDLRAPTPSAAAELAVPEKAKLLLQCRELAHSLFVKMRLHVERLRWLLNNTADRLVDPCKKIQDHRLTTDDYTMRLFRCFSFGLQNRREKLAWQIEKLHAGSPAGAIQKHTQELDHLQDNLLSCFKIYLADKTSKLMETTAKLYALNPEKILKRGYSITRTLPGGAVIMDAASVAVGQDLEIVLSRGTLRATVKGKTPNG